MPRHPDHWVLIQSWHASLSGRARPNRTAGGGAIVNSSCVATQHQQSRSRSLIATSARQSGSIVASILRSEKGLSNRSFAAGSSVQVPNIRHPIAQLRVPAGSQTDRYLATPNLTAYRARLECERVVWRSDSPFCRVPPPPPDMCRCIHRIVSSASYRLLLHISPPARSNKQREA